jgi:hypothetical protein
MTEPSSVASSSETFFMGVRLGLDKLLRRVPSMIMKSMLMMRKYPNMIENALAYDE